MTPIPEVTSSEHLLAAATDNNLKPKEEELFYIQDARSNADGCVLWWRPNGGGYTVDLDDAGKYTRNQAFKGKRETDVPVPCHVAEAITTRVVRLAKLLDVLDKNKDRK